MPYAPTVFKENGPAILEPYGSGRGLRWATVKISDGDRHLCHADLMRMVIECLQGEEAVVNSEYTNQVKKHAIRNVVPGCGFQLSLSAMD
ncbi:hypothetical protein N7447_002217 [Penicillium robsamsonii]|uniref:uncharacterized protein n=1 Tax=Penicillium robsamsonii TaxID=1792511 RepID=UPI0025488A9B|nr:uncharacterized protein N7447_002217 [Penicillium robsamsonii]KAJ5836191.1 hypothetical protein N7447_002217 [Penicillium robsamsonii]